MKYIIMCGGTYPKWESPRQLSKVNGEVLVERTIRLLKENGINDIAVSTNDERFNYLDVEILHNKKDKYISWDEQETKLSSHSWLNAYYPVNEQVCYLHGDVYFSDEAIKTIVETKVKDTMFFCTPDKMDVKQKDRRNVKGREPLAYKVVNYKLFRNAVDDLLNMIDRGEFKEAKCPPIAWNVYRYLNGLDIGKKAEWFGDLNSIFESKGDYVVINDYTTDVDKIEDITDIENSLKGGNMIKVEVIAEFNYGDFYKIKETLVRKSKEKDGHLYVGDTFECDKGTMEYFTGKNQYKKAFVKVIEVKDEPKEELPTNQTGEEITQVEEPKKEIEPITKSTKKTKKKRNN